MHTTLGHLRKIFLWYYHFILPLKGCLYFSSTLPKLGRSLDETRGLLVKAEEREGRGFEFFALFTSTQKSFLAVEITTREPEVRI